MTSYLGRLARRAIGETARQAVQPDPSIWSRSQPVGDPFDAAPSTPSGLDSTKAPASRRASPAFVPHADEVSSQAPGTAKPAGPNGELSVSTESTPSGEEEQQREPLSVPEKPRRLGPDLAERGSPTGDPMASPSREALPGVPVCKEEVCVEAERHPRERPGAPKVTLPGLTKPTGLAEQPGAPLEPEPSDKLDNERPSHQAARHTPDAPPTRLEPPARPDVPTASFSEEKPGLVIGTLRVDVTSDQTTAPASGGAKPVRDSRSPLRRAPFPRTNKLRFGIGAM